MQPGKLKLRGGTISGELYPDDEGGMLVAEGSDGLMPYNFASPIFRFYVGIEDLAGDAVEPEPNSNEPGAYRFTSEEAFNEVFRPSTTTLGVYSAVEAVHLVVGANVNESNSSHSLNESEIIELQQPHRADVSTAQIEALS